MHFIITYPWEHSIFFFFFFFNIYFESSKKFGKNTRLYQQKASKLAQPGCNKAQEEWVAESEHVSKN